MPVIPVSRRLKLEGYIFKARKLCLKEQKPLCRQERWLPPLFRDWNAGDDHQNSSWVRGQLPSQSTLLSIFLIFFFLVFAFLFPPLQLYIFFISLSLVLSDRHYVYGCSLADSIQYQVSHTLNRPLHKSLIMEMFICYRPLQLTLWVIRYLKCPTKELDF